MERLSVNPREVPPSSATSQCTTPGSPLSGPSTSSPEDSPGVSVDYRNGGQKGFFDSLVGCLKPVWTMIGKATAAELKQQGWYKLIIDKTKHLLGPGSKIWLHV